MQNNCETTLSSVVKDSTVKMTAKVTYTQPSCFGKCDAKLVVNVTDGRNGYKYNWTGLSISAQDSVLNALCVKAETASVTVTDALGCEVKTDGIKLISPAAKGLDIIKTKEICPSKVFELNATVPDGVTYKWISPLGKDLDGATIKGDTVGSYKISVTNPLGCVSVDSIKVIASLAVNTFFASPSEAPVNKDVVFVDLTNPSASDVKWEYPASAKLISQDAFKLKLNFSTTGTFKVRELVTVGDCIYPFEKSITIVDKFDDGSFPAPIGGINLDFIILSNPSSENKIKILLNENHPLSFTISVVPTSGEKAIFSKQYQNFKENELLIELPNQSIESNYIISIDNSLNKISKRVMIIK